ncbi:MAG: hypothetical protein OHK0056_14730 [Bacteriovoracaceae bacterium]
MKRFSEEFKDSIIQKSCLPGGPTLAYLAQKHDLPVSTLYGWKRKYAKHSGMSKSNKWTPEQKLEAIIKTASMNENELGEYLRKNGLHSSELEQWREEFMKGVKGPGRPKKDPELAKAEAESKQLKKELRRKEKALAEMSARVILLKKSQEIFGDDEEDE